MRSAVKRIAPLCVLLVIHNTISLKENPQERASQELAKNNFPKKALQAYHNLIDKAQAEKPVCVLNHKQRYEAINKNVDDHWQTCLKAFDKNILLLLSCVRVKTEGDLETIFRKLNELQTCLGGKDKTSEDCSKSPTCIAAYAKQVAEVKNNLMAVKKNNEFNVALEDAKSNNRTHCFHNYHPLVAKYTLTINAAVDNCYKFVPIGHLADFKVCCNDLLQPIQRDIESKLTYVTDCWKKFDFNIN